MVLVRLSPFDSVVSHSSSPPRALVTRPPKGRGGVVDTPMPVGGKKRIRVTEVDILPDYYLYRGPVRLQYGPPTCLVDGLGLKGSVLKTGQTVTGFLGSRVSWRLRRGGEFEYRSRTDDYRVTPVSELPLVLERAFCGTRTDFTQESYVPTTQVIVAHVVVWCPH